MVKMYAKYSLLRLLSENIYYRFHSFCYFKSYLNGSNFLEWINFYFLTNLFTGIFLFRYCKFTFYYILVK